MYVLDVIEYNMRNIFLEKSSTKCARKTTQAIDVSLIIETVSSTYLFQGFICLFNVGLNVRSRCTMKIPASTGPKGEPIATP